MIQPQSEYEINTKEKKHQEEKNLAWCFSVLIQIYKI